MSEIVKKFTGIERYIENNFKLAIEYTDSIIKLISKEIFNEELELVEFNKELQNSELYKKGVISSQLSKIEMMLKVEDKRLIGEMLNILVWFYHDFKKVDLPREIQEYKKNNKEKIKIQNYNDLVKDGWSITDITRGVLDVCVTTIEGMTDELIGDFDVWVDVIANAKELFSTLVCHGEIIGYWHITPMTDKDFKTTLKGNLDENEITVKRTIKKGKYKAYISAVGIIPEYRTARTLSLLMDSFFKQLIELAKKGIIISEWVANTFTNEGESMCMMLDMKYICDHYIDGKIYYRKFYPIDVDSSFNKKYPEIIELYSKL